MISIKSTLSEIFEILAYGKQEEFKEAKKIIEKKWRVCDSEFDNEWPLVEKYIDEFDLISNSLNRAAVISGLSLFYLVFADDHFETLKNFTLKNITDQNGHVREAIRHASDWLYTSLSARAKPFVYPEGKELTQKQVEEQEIAIAQYFSLVKEIESLMEKYDDGTEDGAQYIDEMKPSIHKSLQMFWSRLTDNRVYRYLLEKNSPVPFETFIKRKEIESKINVLLKQAKSDFDFEDVKEAIYNEEGSDDMREIISMFDTGEEGAPELNDVLEVITDAWNYFPHQVLDGQSPSELSSGYHNIM